MEHATRLQRFEATAGAVAILVVGARRSKRQQRPPRNLLEEIDWLAFFFLRTPETSNCGPSTNIHATQIRMGVVCVKCCSGTRPMASGLVAFLPPNWHIMGVRMNVPKGS